MQENQKALEALEFAIRDEVRAYNFYKLLAEKTEDRKVRYLCKNLSQDELIHRKMLEDMGFYANEHYIEIKDNHDIERAWGEMTENMKEEMIERAYKMTITRHTHLNRAMQLIKDYESGEWKYGEN